MDGTTLKINKDNIIKDYNMQYNKVYLHPEEGEDFRLNQSLTEIQQDISKLDEQYKNTAEYIDYLLKNTVNRLDMVKKNISEEKERLQDITMLCNKFTDFDDVIVLKEEDFSGKYSHNEGLFCAAITSNALVTSQIKSVFGNGYEGNKYVYKNNKYITESLDTSIRSAINDNSISSYWEYSRITAANTEPFLINDFNTDSEEAKCTLTIQGKEAINEIEVTSENEKTVIVGAQYSKNGVDYQHLNFDPVTINSKEDSYKNYGYIYGSGKIAIPNCKYVKLTFESQGYTNDVIAFQRKISDEETELVQEQTTVVKTGKRHVVKLNDLYCYNNSYDMTNVFNTRDLISEKVYSIALFCNAYIPEGLNKDAIEFVFTVNGVDYKVEPVNSHNDGIKIIRFSQGSSSPKYTKYIGEPIKSAILTIKLKAKSNVTPYINNLKVLIGGEI
jgi:hypothetical protein